MSLVHHIHRLRAAVCLGRRAALKGEVGLLGVVEGDPVANDPFGVEAIAQLVRIDRLVLVTSVIHGGIIGHANCGYCPAVSG